MFIPRCCVSSRGIFQENNDFLTRDSLEIYFKDSRSLLVVFASRKSRQDFSDKLTSSVSLHIQGPPRSPLVLKTPLLGMVGSRVLNGFKDEIGTAQRKWQAREISNVRQLLCFLSNQTYYFSVHISQHHKPEFGAYPW